jgi:hypothetical protein
MPRRWAMQTRLSQGTRLRRLYRHTDCTACTAGDPMETFCNSNPSEVECKVYED